MTGLVLRGRVLTFVAEPQGRHDAASYRYWEDGAVFINDGRIVSVGDYHAHNIAGASVVDHRPHLILPGLIDAHVHYPQMQVIGSYAGALLEWLNRYTFVEEQKFVDSAHANRIASRFLDELIRHGTTTAATFCTVHRQSAEAFFSAAEERNMRVLGGKVMMDRNAPGAL
jgi:guanine deaminase